jgi:hypothetical protein
MLRQGHRRSRRTAGFLLALTTAFGLLLAGANVVFAGDTPAGFWYGSDTNYPHETGTINRNAPLDEPVVGGDYGGYFGELGTFYDVLGESHSACVPLEYRYFNSTNASDAAWDYDEFGAGVGAGGYFFMAGPGKDPGFNDTASEASSWGELQGEKAVAEWNAMDLNFPILFGDFEGNYDYGWNDVWNFNSSTCGYTKNTGYTGIASSIDRATFNGFWDYIEYDTTTAAFPGAYSSPDWWNLTFSGACSGSNPNACIQSTWEWTSENESSISPGPSSWTEGSTTAQFFGGQTSSSAYALMWQWTTPSETGCSTSSDPTTCGDFDQIDGNRYS